MSMSTLDPGQVLKSAYDEATQSLRTELVSGGIAGTVAIKDGASSNEATVLASGGISVALQDGVGNLLTSTGGALDINFAGGVDQGSPNNDANAWPIRITDGTHDVSVSVANALKVDGSAVTQPISAAFLPLPAGASTAANQSTANTSLSSIDSKIVHVDTGSVTVAASALPSGAATSANQTTANTSLSSIDGKLASLGQKTSAGSEPVVIASDQSAIPVTQSGTWNVNNISGTVSLPTGASTEATLSSLNGKVNVVDTNNVAITTALPAGANNIGSIDIRDSSGNALNSTSNALNVSIQNATLNTTVVGFASSGFVRNDYSSVNVTTAAYVQLIASTAAAAKEVEIFDSSGQTLKLAVGGSGSEVDQILIFPGGNGRVKLAIPASSRISVRAVSGNATVGEIDINLYG